MSDTTNLNVVEMPPPEVPFYNLDNAHRLSHYLHLIPPREKGRPERMFWEYRILSHPRTRVLFVEWYMDDYSPDQVPEGILAFSRGFECGFIGPDGEVYNGSTGARYRASLVEVHGDRKITTLEMGDGHYMQPLHKDHWPAMVTYIKNERIRNGMIHSSINNPPHMFASAFDFLVAAHEVHVESSRFGLGFDEVSAITLF